MSIGNVKRVHIFERLDQRSGLRGTDAPDPMLDTIERSEVDKRLGRRPHALDNLVDPLIRAMREKHRPGLRPQLNDMASAIVFLVLPRSLVLLNDVAIVFSQRIATGDAGLA